MSKKNNPTIPNDGYEVHCGYRIRLMKAKAGKRYQVDLGRKSGKHVRKAFHVLQDARNWAHRKSIEASNKGIAALSFSDEQKADAVEALHFLMEFGANLRTAAAFYAKHHKKVDRTNGLEPLIEQFLKEQNLRLENGELRLRTYDDLKARLAPFKENLGHLAVDVVDANDIDSLMDKLGHAGVNRRNYKRCLSGFFNWAVRNKKVGSNPVSETKAVKTEINTPEIYTPAEVQNVMNKSAQLHKEIVPYLAIAFFAGIRPTEIQRLNWQDIDLNLGEIHVRAGQSKTRTARIVHVSRNLTLWLMKYRKPDGLIFPHSDSTLKRWRTEVYEAAKVECIQDGARHTFATFYYALHTLDDTMQELGHTESRMLFRHYRGLAKNRKAQAEKFFDIEPPKEKKDAKPIQFRKEGVA